MAIVIKVKADTKELEKDIKEAASKAQSAINNIGSGGTGSTGRGAAGINKINEEFKRMRTEAEALRPRLNAVEGSFSNVSKNALLAATAIGALAAAAIGAATAFVKMGLEGSKLADTLIETAFAAGKTVEQMQKLEKGGRDLTGQLRAVGGVLDFEMIKKASRATDQFAIFGKQVDALKIKLAVDLSGAFESAGRAMQQSLLRAEPSVRESTRRMSNAFEAMIPVIARVTEASFNLFAFQMGNAAAVIRAFQTPTPRTSTIDTRHAQTLPRFAAMGEFRDFLRSPEALARAQQLRGTGAGGRAAAASRGETLPTGSIDAIQALGRVLETLEENAIAAARAIGAMNARTLEILAGRERLRRQLEDIPTVTAEQAGLTSGVDDTRIRGQIAEFDQFMSDEAAKAFDEVRQQAIRFKEGIVFTFESAFREGFERGPKAFLQATASAIKSFFSQIAAELSTGIIEMILFGKGGMSGRGVGSGGALGGLGAVLGGFGGGGGGGGLGGLLGSFGGLGGGTFGGSIFGGGAGGGSIGVAPSISGGGFGGAFGSVANAAAQKLGVFGAGTAGAGGLFGGIGGLAGIAGPALLGGLLGSGLGGKSTGGKILGGIGGAIGGIGAAVGIGVGLAGGGILFGALAATGFGLLAAPFLIGAILLGKAKQRKNDEQAADAIWVAERDQLRQIIQAVNADRMDGASALAQAQALRSATVQQLSQIKTKSVRESRLSNQLRDLDNGVVAELRAAVERQARRRGVQGGLVPEFAGGGYVQGVDRGYDSVLVRARPGEVILNKQQQSMVQSRAGYRIFEDVGIQQFQAGGRVSPAPAAPESLHVTLAFEGDAQAIVGNLIVRGVETSSGQRAIVSVIKNGRKNGDL